MVFSALFKGAASAGAGLGVCAGRVGAGSGWGGGHGQMHANLSNGVTFQGLLLLGCPM